MAIDQIHATQRLSISTDHLRTWQPIDQAPVGPEQEVTNFWLSAGGELLAEVATSTGAALQPTSITSPTVFQRVSIAHWHSADGDAHWEAFLAPTIFGARVVPSVVVEKPAAGQPWHICAL